MRNKLFCLTLAIFLLLGTGIFVLPQRSESAREKRELAVNSDITFDFHLPSSAESVLKDQFYFRDDVTKNYFESRILFNKVIDRFVKSNAKLILKIRQLLHGGNSETIENDLDIEKVEILYLSDEVVQINDNYLINAILPYEDADVFSASQRGYNVNEFAAMYPDLDLYIYFPTRMEEMLNREKGYQLLCRESFLQQLPGHVKTSSLQISTVEDHERYFYRSDAHWTAEGAYQAYRDIIDMIGKDYEIAPVKEVAEEITYPYPFTGNIASKIGGNGEPDHLRDYVLKDLGDFDYYIDGQLTEFGAAKKDYAENGNSSVYSDYDWYFGDNPYSRLFDFHQEEYPDILIFADSYINTNMSWIASSFNKTQIIDLRLKPEDFSMKELIASFDPDIVLITYPYTDMYFNGNLFLPLD